MIISFEHGVSISFSLRTQMQMITTLDIVLAYIR
jgi:hypothetical protein